MSRNGELLCAWTGPLCVVMFFIAWVVFARWMPPPTPAMSAEQIAAVYQARTVPIRTGMMLMMYSGPLYGIFSAIIMTYMLRMKGPAPALAYGQLTAGTATIMFLIIPAQIYGATVFRPDRAADITYFGNDLGWFMFDMVNSTLIAQYLTLGTAVFLDHADRPVFPRWFAFFNFWSALALIPAGLITFFKTGPFSWSGILGFYLGVVVFTLWCLITFWQLLKAIKQQRINSST
jgi:hypothetical protein